MSFIEIKNDEGLRASLLSYGATLTSLKFKNNEGKEVDCVLGYDTKEDYLKDEAYLGRTIGRVANRVKDGQFIFKGKLYNLPINCNPHNHHGGPNSTAFNEWEIIRQFPHSITFRIECSEEVDGFPGDAKIDVTYTVNDRNQLVVEHYATCTMDSVLALAHHPYFNLDGSDDVGQHKIVVNADRYLPTDDNSCPTGHELLVESTPFDLRQAQPVDLFRNSQGILDIDHDFVLSPSNHAGDSSLSFWSGKSGIKVNISTSYPVIHLYGAKYLKSRGKKGAIYGAGAGLAIEAQFHSAALNYKNFPDITLKSEEPYHEEVIYSFSHL